MIKRQWWYQIKGRLTAFSSKSLQLLGLSSISSHFLTLCFFFIFFIAQAQDRQAACQTTGICSRAPDSHARSVHTSEAKKSITLLWVNTGRTWESTLSASQRLVGGWWEDRQSQVPVWSCFTFRDETVLLLPVYMVQNLGQLKISQPLHSRNVSGPCQASQRQNISRVKQRRVMLIPFPTVMSHTIFIPTNKRHVM